MNMLIYDDNKINIIINIICVFFSFLESILSTCHLLDLSRTQ